MKNSTIKLAPCVDRIDTGINDLQNIFLNNIIESTNWAEVSKNDKTAVKQVIDLICQQFYIKQAEHLALLKIINISENNPFFEEDVAIQRAFRILATFISHNLSISDITPEELFRLVNKNMQYLTLSELEQEDLYTTFNAIKNNINGKIEFLASSPAWRKFLSVQPNFHNIIQEELKAIAQRKANTESNKKRLEELKAIIEVDMPENISSDIFEEYYKLEERLTKAPQHEKDDLYLKLTKRYLKQNTQLIQM